MNIGLSNSVQTKINQVLANYPEVEQAVLYGSRAKGNFRAGSDIDLALRGERISFRQILSIKHQLDELPIPYTIDVNAFRFIDNEDLINHINRVGKVFYSSTVTSYHSV
ncbi:MAG: nucleotidyltransferase domain-containing protein [Cyclobacteriaceae bacterium]|nr:nucleotidyltransferase domain-containing protein [Cyclobacteriaceae bacterium]